LTIVDPGPSLIRFRLHAVHCGEVARRVGVEDDLPRLGFVTAQVAIETRRDTMPGIVDGRWLTRAASRAAAAGVAGRRNAT
jgi:hypothetical protein